MTRKISISILPDGTIAAEASGTPGPDCLGALEQMQLLLNANILDSRPTPEFSESPTVARISLQNDHRLEDRA